LVEQPEKNALNKWITRVRAPREHPAAAVD